VTPEPILLTIDEIAAIHVDQIDRYGGSHGVRDSNGLESAIAQPSATFSGKYLHPNLFSMAAVYLYHLVQNHPFVDGNKRVGTVTALVFLELNDIRIDADPDELADFVIEVAKGRVSKEKIAAYLRKSAASESA
jgi:death on curing protein